MLQQSPSVRIAYASKPCQLLVTFQLNPQLFVKLSRLTARRALSPQLKVYVENKHTHNHTHTHTATALLFVHTILLNFFLLLYYLWKPYVFYYQNKKMKKGVSVLIWFISKPEGSTLFLESFGTPHHYCLLRHA